ncbi:MAG: energy transducer TonB [Novosphingobium sp.]|nr:energy transducer TonB [Novosphingobium sp.]
MDDARARAELAPSRRARAGAFVAVALLHVVALMVLIRAFEPELGRQAARAALSAFTVTVTPPRPSPTPTPKPVPPLHPRAANAGQPRASGSKAQPQEVVAPTPPVIIATTRAPATTGGGFALSSGAQQSGKGTGAGAAGTGPGAGGSGSGTGGGAVTKPLKIAGEINSARDYPSETRDLRIGDFVIIYLTVGTDGRAHDCRVVRPSRDPRSDAITCRLAVDRFRFEPATDFHGNAVESAYGWRQRWFY